MQIKILSLFISLVIASCATKETNEQRIARIHQEVLTVDTHSDTPLNLMDSTFNLGIRHDARIDGSRCDFPRMKEGGLDAIFFAVFIGQQARSPEGNAKAIHKTHQIFDATFRAVEKHSNLAAFAKDPDDAYILQKEDKRAIYLGIENGYAIGRDLSLIEKYYGMGARYITLCHTKNNDICDSANDEPEHNGLSEFGDSVVKEMNRLGMLIDVSHISEKAFFDVLNATSSPVFASHSCSKAICDNPRNLSDEQILALKKNGGLIQMCILSDYVKEPLPYPARDSAYADLKKRSNNYQFKNDEEQKSTWDEWRNINKKYPQKLATVSDMVDHIDHIVKLAGIDYVGIGTDFDGGGGLEDCYDVSELQNITAELVKRDYSDEDIKKIWGDNFMRVFKKVMKNRAVL